jgi:hypothetical protein
MLKDLKFTFCSAAVTSASFSQAGAFGYGAVVAIAAALVSALARAIWRSLHQIGRDGDQFGLRNVRATCRGREATFSPLLLVATANMTPSNKTSHPSGASSC